MPVPYDFKKWMRIQTNWYYIKYSQYGIACTETIEARDKEEARKIFRYVHGDKKILEVRLL